MAKQPRSLRGKVVAITGGARGIGRATASALLREGARVAIGDIDPALARRTAGELGSGCVALELDVTKPDSFARFLDALERELGPLDILINNAGIMPLGPFHEESDRTAARQLDINVHGVITGTKLAVARMRPRRSGHVVNLASYVGRAPFKGGATYVATKHAVVGLSYAVWLENRDLGIDVSVVMPGVVDTELASGLASTRAVKVVEPEEVADAIVETLRRPRIDVYVPRSLGVLWRIGAVLPARAGILMSKLFRSEGVLSEADRSARAAYEARAAGAGGAPPASAAEEPADRVEAAS
jgi:NAD(P)-dependent dehydrogenase (short-subunit alcohol dehydrogenase family)